MNACWKSGCTRDATEKVSGDGWAIRSCSAHIATARAVTGDRPVRGRSGQGTLFDALGGGE